MLLTNKLKSQKKKKKVTFSHVNVVHTFRLHSWEVEGATGRDHEGATGRDHAGHSCNYYTSLYPQENT